MLQNLDQTDKKHAVINTVYFKHQYIMMPTYTEADAIVAALNKLIWVLQNETPSNIGQTEKDKLTTLARIFNTVAMKMTNMEPNQSSAITNPNIMQSRAETKKMTMAITGKHDHQTHQKQLQTQICQQQQLEISTWQLTMGQQNGTKHIVTCPKEAPTSHM